MHLGAFSSAGTSNCNNFVHVLFNNGAHDSVGAQNSNGFNFDFPMIAKACGYKNVYKTTTEEEINKIMPEINNKNTEGPVFLEIRIKTGARPDLGRPKLSPKENKMKFMEFLRTIEFQLQIHHGLWRCGSCLLSEPKCAMRSA